MSWLDRKARSHSVGVFFAGTGLGAFCAGLFAACAIYEKGNTGVLWRSGVSTLLFVAFAIVYGLAGVRSVRLKVKAAIEGNGTADRG